MEEPAGGWAQREEAKEEVIGGPEQPMIERCWVQLSEEEKVELLRQVVMRLAGVVENHQHSAQGWLVVTPESLVNTLS